MLTVTARSSTQNLVTLATVRNRLLKGDTSEDAVLQELIEGACSAIASYLGRELGRQKYQWSTPGIYERRLVLPRFPIDRDSVTVTITDVATTDVVVIDADAGLLYRYLGFPAALIVSNSEENVVVTFTAGFVLPDQVVKWAIGATVAKGQFVKPSSPSLSPYLFEVTTTGGTLAGSEPDWSTITGTSQAIAIGGGQSATSRDAQELPALFRDLAYVEVFNRYVQSSRAPGLASQSGDGVSESYVAAHTQTELAPNVAAALDRYLAVIA